MRARQIDFSSFIGFVQSSVKTSNTGAENAAALLSDFQAANGNYVVVEPGTYVMGELSTTEEYVSLWMMPGSQFVSDTGVVKMFQTTNSNVNLEGLNIDGLDIAETGWRSDGGTFSAHNTTITRIGKRLTLNSGEAHALLVKTVRNLRIDGLVITDCNAMGNGVFADAVGAVRPLLVYECSDYYITNVRISSGTTGEDNDLIHFLDLRTPVQMYGTMENVTLIYNEYNRRCLKYQGGYHFLNGLQVVKDPNFVAVSGSTDVGVNNVNCVDYAGPFVGFLHVSHSRIDATGFQYAFCNSGGTGGRIHGDNIKLTGSVLNVIRNNPESGSPENVQTNGFYTTSTDNGSSLINSEIYGFARPLVPQGSNTTIRYNVIDDPRDLWIEAGTSTQKAGLDLIGNKVITRTAGYMGTTRCGRINNFSGMRIDDNVLIQAGNTTHAGRFIDLTHASCSGTGRGNNAPIATPATIPLACFTAAAENFRVQESRGKALTPWISSTPVGNVGTGEDNLISHSLPIYTLYPTGNAVRTTHYGNTANNANAKTLKFYIGATAVLTVTLTTNKAAKWKLVAEVMATSTTAQRYGVIFHEIDNTAGTVLQVRSASGTLAETTSGNVALKCTGEATSNNDIQTEYAVTESLEGTILVV